MSDVPDRFLRLESLLAQFTLWVSTQPDVLAAALVGSYARTAATAASDVDLLILTTTVGKYFTNHEWATYFGTVVTCAIEDCGRVTALRVCYQDDLEVEFNFARPDWAGVPVDAGTHRVVADGMRILYDPARLLKTLRQAVANQQ